MRGVVKREGCGGIAEYRRKLPGCGRIGHSGSAALIPNQIVDAKNPARSVYLSEDQLVGSCASDQ